MPLASRPQPPPLPSPAGSSPGLSPGPRLAVRPWLRPCLSAAGRRLRPPPSGSGSFYPPSFSPPLQDRPPAPPDCSPRRVICFPLHQSSHHIIADEFSGELADDMAYVAGHDDENVHASIAHLVFRIK